MEILGTEGEETVGRHSLVSTVSSPGDVTRQPQRKVT